MQLANLLADLPEAIIVGEPSREIQGIAYDSRQVLPGYLFVAIPGAHVDGHDFIRQALSRGAAAVLVERARLDDLRAALPQATLAGVPAPRVALAPVAARWYRFPGRQMRVVGITGTDGKTTTTYLTAMALEAAGRPSGMMGTLDFKIGARQWANSSRQSTPEALEVQALLREMADAGCHWAVLEATSHALSDEWNRLGGCAFDVAVLTNVTHEHLDYHGTVERYRQAKANLFRLLGEGGGERLAGKQIKRAIVNADDPHHRLFLEAAPASAERLRYGVAADADVRARQVVARRDGLAFRLESPWGVRDINLKLTGLFNVANALAALTIALAEGVPLEAAVPAIERVPGVRGRMQPVECGQPFTVLVDYAHTPGAFEKLLPLVRPLTSGRLIAVFGSAGERDRDKRAEQGRIAAHYCDQLFLTDEDPRGEDRHAILDMIAAGAAQAGKRDGHGYVCIPDRAAAILAALAAAQPGDIVLLLGKGHEGSILYADHSIPWDEAGEARRALATLGYTGCQH